MFCYTVPIADGTLALTVTVADGTVRAPVTDRLTGDEYTLHLVGSATGAFVSSVRADYERILTAVRDACFPKAYARRSMLADLTDVIRSLYGDEPQYLFERDNETAVWRRKDNGRWYGVAMPLSKRKLGLPSDEVVQTLLLHVDPDELDRIVDGRVYFRGYHMNKKHWMTVCLDGSVGLEELTERIATSYALGAKGKAGVRKRKN